MQKLQELHKERETLNAEFETKSFDPTVSTEELQGVTNRLKEIDEEVLLVMESLE